MLKQNHESDSGSVWPVWISHEFAAVWILPHRRSLSTTTVGKFAIFSTSTMTTVLRPTATKLKGIQGFPTEIFLMVFKLVINTCLHENPSARVHNILLTLRLVCKGWEQLLVKCPTFWTALDCSLPPKVQQIFLARSAALPLTVDARWNAGLPATLDTLGDFPAMHRVQTLHFFIIDNRDNLDSVNRAWRTLCKEAPALRTFALYGGFLAKSMSSKWFGGIPPPKLSIVTLQYCEINLSSPWLLNVTGLYLRKIRRPSYADLLPALQRLSNLRQLWIEESLPSEYPPTGDHRRQILPSLMDISITDQNIAQCCWFMEQIETPALRYVTMNGRFLLGGNCSGAFEQIDRLLSPYYSTKEEKGVKYLVIEVKVSTTTAISINGFGRRYGGLQKRPRIFSVSIAGIQDRMRHGIDCRINGEQQQIVESAITRMGRLLRGAWGLTFAEYSTESYAMEQCWWEVFAKALPRLGMASTGNGQVGGLFIALKNDHDRVNEGVDGDDGSEWMFPELVRVRGNGQGLEPEERLALERVLEIRTSKGKPFKFIEASKPSD